MAAHAADLIHRDIKPSNILRSFDGVVKIADFGVARIIADNFPRLTVVNTTVGTPAFMSPEQCRGEELDGRTDLYSLGATFFVLLTGTHPFIGDDVAVLSAHCSVRVPDPRALRPDIPPGCTQLIDRAMAKMRDKRLANAAEMLQALLELQTQALTAPALPMATPAVEVSPLEATVRMAPVPAKKPGGIRKLWFGVAGLLALVPLGLALGLCLLLTRTPVVAPPDAPGKQAEKPPEEPKKPDAGPIALRSALKWKGHETSVPALAFSPTGERLYSCSLDKSVRCWDADRESRRWDFDKMINAIALTPDGNTLAAGSEGGRVYLWEPNAGKPAPAFRSQGGNAIFALAFSPAGDLLAVGTGGGFEIWGKGEGNRFTRRYGHPKPQYYVGAVAFAPDGKSVAWVNLQREVHAIHVPGWQARANADQQQCPLSAVVFTADSQGVFFGGRREDAKGPDGLLLRWDLGNGQPQPMNPPSLVRTLALSPGGGTLVAAGAWGGPLRLYDLHDGRVRLAPVRLNAAVQVLCFSPDGKSLAAGCDTGDIQRWDVSRLEEK
jgi:hypothetical protein